MGRLDRRGRDPHPGDLRGLQLAEIADKTIVPQTRNGVLRTRKEDISMNRAYQAFGIPKNMQQFVNRYVFHGGTSKLWGKNPKIEESAGPGIPPEYVEIALAVIGSFPEPLSVQEQEAIAIFVVRMLDAGNWEIMKAFHNLKFASPVNCYHDWIRGTADWLSNSPTGPIPGVGLQLGFYDPGYTSLLNTIPLNVIAPVPDNLGYYVFIEEDQSTLPNAPTSQISLINVSGTNLETLYTQAPANASLIYQGPTGGAESAPIAGSFDSQSLHGMFREDAANTSYYKDGTIVDTQAIVSSGVNSEGTFRVGGGTAGISYLGIVSSTLITEAVGFDHAAYNTALIELNANLAI